MSEEEDKQTPEETEEIRKKRHRWLRWVGWFTRFELAVAALVALGLCVGRVLVAPEYAEMYQVVWKILVAPAYLAGMALTFFVARAAKRHPGTVVAELSFWAVFPGCAFVLLFLLERMLT